MSKIRYTTRVISPNEEVEALVTSITRFLGSPLTPDELVVLSQHYISYIKYAKKLQNPPRDSKLLKFYCECYESARKNFYSTLNNLRIKYDIQQKIPFPEASAIECKCP